MNKWVSRIGIGVCILGILVSGYYLALVLTLPEIYLHPQK